MIQPTTILRTDLLGQLLALGEACGIIGLCLYGPYMPMEQSGIVMYIYLILHIYHILHIFIFIEISVVGFCSTRHDDLMAILKYAPWPSSNMLHGMH